MPRTLHVSRFMGLAALFLFAESAAPRGNAFAADAEVRVLSAVGMRQVMLDLGPKFERATGYRLKRQGCRSGECTHRVSSHPGSASRHPGQRDGTGRPVTITEQRGMR